MQKIVKKQIFNGEQGELHPFTGRNIQQSCRQRNLVLGCRVFGSKKYLGHFMLLFGETKVFGSLLYVTFW